LFSGNTHRWREPHRGEDGRGRKRGKKREARREERNDEIGGGR